MVIGTYGDDLTIHRLVSNADAERWRAGFIGAYQTVFEGAPYHERFYPSEAEGVFRMLVGTPKHITLIVENGAGDVAAFAAAIPLRAKPSVARELSGLVPLAHTFYLAELGVLPKYRRQGLGRELVMHRLNLVDDEQYTHVVLRVSASRNASFEMYKDLGFEDMGVYMEVSGMRTDGQVRTDRRLFMAKVLSQIPQDHSST